MAAPTFKQVSRVGAKLGESPVWDPVRSCIWWVDIEGQRLFCTSVDSGETQGWDTPEQIGFVVIADNGAVFAGMETGFFQFDPDTGAFELCAKLHAGGVRFNDATVDPAGRLWAGTMDLENKRPVGVLYRIGPDLVMEPVIEGLNTPNGLAVDGARGRLYLSDSHPSVQTIWACSYDPASGAIGPRDVFVVMNDFAGRPDGAALDRDGNYWIAGIGGGVLHVFAPDGHHLRDVETANATPTKPMFGGTGLDRMYLTGKDAPLTVADDLGGFVGQMGSAFKVKF